MDFSRTIDDIEQLPENPLEAWVGIAERAFRQTLVENGSLRDSNTIDSNMNQLIDFLRQLAKKLEVTGPSIPSNPRIEVRQEYVREYITRQRNTLIADNIAKKVGATNTVADAIQISNIGLVKIHTLLGELRRSVGSTDLPEKQKEKLQRNLNEFERELISRSVSATKVFTVLALVGAALAGVTSTVADAPSALDTIGKMIAYFGIEKDNQEEAERIASESEPLMLMPPSAETEAR